MTVVNLVKDSSTNFIVGDYVGLVGSYIAHRISFVWSKGSTSAVYLTKKLYLSSHITMVEIEGSNNEQLNGVFKVLGAHEGKVVIRTSGLSIWKF